MDLRLPCQGAMCHLASDRPTVTHTHSPACALARMRRPHAPSRNHACHHWSPASHWPCHARPRRPSRDRTARASFTRHDVTEDSRLNWNRKRARYGQGLHCKTAGAGRGGRQDVDWGCGFLGGILASGSRRSGNRCGVAVRTAPTSRYSFRSRTSLRSSHCSVFCAGATSAPRRRPRAPSAPTRVAPERGWNEFA